MTPPVLLINEENDNQVSETESEKIHPSVLNFEEIAEEDGPQIVSLPQESIKNEEVEQLEEIIDEEIPGQVAVLTCWSDLRASLWL